MGCMEVLLVFSGVVVTSSLSWRLLVRKQLFTMSKPKELRMTTAKIISFSLEMVTETIEKVVENLGASDIDSRLELFIDDILYAFQEQTNDDVNVMLN
ncbi:hypothetical protein H5410_019298 [Solanum commersonii]|uniref:Uncharacterized protein n=1 Tax=Solanum commersonii TaxID=4109 RepID=A0A9J6A531_SOLCO|nr:hypothetical protein H5410_019298 [Solanum commersonii]